jgi:hypothetical protein
MLLLLLTALQHWLQAGLSRDCSTHANTYAADEAAMLHISAQSSQSMCYIRIHHTATHAQWASNKAHPACTQGDQALLSNRSRLNTADDRYTHVSNAVLRSSTSQSAADIQWQPPPPQPHPPLLLLLLLLPAFSACHAAMPPATLLTCWKLNTCSSMQHKQIAASGERLLLKEACWWTCAGALSLARGSCSVPPGGDRLKMHMRYRIHETRVRAIDNTHSNGTPQKCFQQFCSERSSR